LARFGFVGGGGLVYWCAWAFTWVGRRTPNPGDPPRELGASGLCRYSRNFLYVGVLAVILVQTVLFQPGVLLG
jgi:protein-S-isoprenylcysteine O-methyltransferase Ste14